MPLLLSLMFLLFFFGIFLFFLSFLFLCLLCFLFFLSFSLFVCCFPSPFSLCIPMAFYTACCDKIYHFYPLTTFDPLWMSFQDCPSGLPLPLHCVGCTTPHSWTKRFWFCLLPLLILPSGQGLNLSFTNFYRMHLVISTHVCFFWVRCHVSRTFLPKRTWARTPK